MKYSLVESTLRNAKPKAKPYKLNDGGGLYVHVSTTGNKSWRFDYRLGGKYKTLYLGLYPALSQRNARIQHGVAADLVKSGGDPARVKQDDKIGSDSRPTFRRVTELWEKDRALGPERAKRTNDADNRMIRYLNAEFGDVAIDDVRVKHLSGLLQKFQDCEKAPTRVRLQGMAKKIAGLAVARGLIELNPFSEVKFAAGWTTPKSKKRPAITRDPEAFGQLLRKIEEFRGYEGNTTRQGLRLLALTFVRPGELAEARWADFDLNGGKWVIPFEQLKMRTQRAETESELAEEPHEVPLARQAVAILRELQKRTGNSEFLFPSRNGDKPIFQSKFNDALNLLGYKDIHCAHGFRSSASTFLNKQRRDGRRLFERAVIEVQLDHVDASTRAIYDRDGLWEERAELMQYWADMIDTLRRNSPQVRRPDLRLVAA